MLRLLLLLFLTAATSSAEVGYLFIDSDPIGAGVVIDGRSDRTWQTPALCTLAVGEHNVTVSMEYYRSQSVTIEIEPERVSRRIITFLKSDMVDLPAEGHIPLQPESGELTVLTDVSGAVVWLDSVAVKTPAPVTLRKIAAGEHRITLEYQGLVFDTTVVVPINGTRVIQIDLADMVVESEGGVVANRRVPLSIVVDLPGCSYLRTDERLELRSNMAILGVDPKVRIRAGDTTIELSHLNLATDSVVTDQQGKVKRKYMPPTELEFTPEIAIGDSIEIGVVTYAWDGGRLVARDRLTPKKKSWIIRGDFNFGELIRIRLKVSREGEILLRYW